MKSIPTLTGLSVKIFSDIREVLDYLQTSCEKWLLQSRQKEGILLTDFLDLPPFMQKFVLSELYRRTNGDIKKFNRSHLEQILAVLRSKRAGIKKEFGEKYFIGVEKSDGTGRRFINIKISIKKAVLLKKNKNH